MPSPTAANRVYRFGPFEADLDNARLSRKGTRVRLQEQPFRVLALLLEHAGHIVTREELRQQLWPAGTHVDFEGSLNAAMKRLRTALGEDAEHALFIETIPKRGYRFIAPLAAPAPAGRPVIVSAPLAPPAATAPPAARFRSRWRLRAISLALLLTAAWVLPRWRRVPAPPPPAALVRVRPSVAVLGFHNASGFADQAWISTALSEMLRTELGAGNRLRIVPGEAVAQFPLPAPWSVTDSLRRDTAARIGQALAGDWLVTGSYVQVGQPGAGTLRVDFRLQKAQTGDIGFAGSETGSPQQIFRLVSGMGAALRQHLGLPQVTAGETAGIISSQPSNADAERFYALGLESMRQADLASARDLFLQTARITPGFPLVHAMLARAWGGLGYDQKARLEAQRAFELARALPETEKLLVAGTYYSTLHDSGQAIAAYRALFALEPDSVDSAEQLIVSLNAAGHREEALAVVHQLRQLPAPVSQDPRIDFWEGSLLSYTHGTQVSPLLNTAVAKAAASGQKLLYARFRLDQCLGLIYSDRPQAANAACQEAYDIFLAAGNRLMAADALRMMADRRGSEGDYQGALALYQRALAMLGALGEHEKTGAVRNNMAIVYENQGQMEPAESLFRQAEQDFQTVGDTGNVAICLVNLADIRLARGELSGAAQVYQRAQDLTHAAGGQDSNYALHNLAAIHLFQGDVPGAAALAQQADAAAQRVAKPQEIASALSVVGDIALAQDHVPAARDAYQRALTLRRTLGDQNMVNESESQLAQVELEQGATAAAAAALRQSLAAFQGEDAVLDEIRAQTQLAHALRLQSDFAGATAALATARRLSRTSRDPSLILPLQIEDALLQAAARPAAVPAGARRELETALRSAQDAGYVSLECEARLALGELEIRSDPARARSGLAALAQRTRALGLERIARHAEALLQGQAAPAAGAHP